MFLNASSPPGGAVAQDKDSFANALSKNMVAMLVWLVLSVINGSMVHTFLQHRYTLARACVAAATIPGETGRL